MKYLNLQVPDKYFCSLCKASGCKLWRGYNSFNVELLCVDCALKEDEKDYFVNEQGLHWDKYGQSSDQIGWYVPAIPTEEEDGYWGYTSVPMVGVEWWRALPLRIK